MMLMKSKYRANGKEIAICDFRDYRSIDNFLHKSRVRDYPKFCVKSIQDLQDDI